MLSRAIREEEGQRGGVESENHFQRGEINAPYAKELVTKELRVVSERDKMKEQAVV